MVEQRLVEAGRARDRQRGERRAIERGKLQQLVARQPAGALLLEPGEQRVEGDPVGLALGAEAFGRKGRRRGRSEEHTSELTTLMSHSYAVFCLKKKNTRTIRSVQHE